MSPLNYLWITLLCLVIYRNVYSEPICKDAMSHVPDDMIVSCSLRCARYGYEIESTKASVPHRVQYFHLKEINFTEARCVDKQAPRFTKRCPHSMIFFTEIGSRSAAVNWTLRAIDNSRMVPKVNCSHEPGDYEVGEYDISCKAIDEAGNMKMCEFHVSVRSMGCPELKQPAHGSLRCDEWRYGRLCFQECDKQYDIPPGSMFPNLFVCGVTGLWTPNIVPDCILPIEATGLVLQANIRLNTHVCDDIVTGKARLGFLSLLETSDVLNVCEWNAGCVIHNITVTCGPAYREQTENEHGGMMVDGAGMNVVDMTSERHTVQEELVWYERPEVLSDVVQPRSKRDLSSRSSGEIWSFSVNISFSFALNFSTSALESGTAYDWMTYLGSKELYDAAVFMQTQTESGVIGLEIPNLDWKFHDDPFDYGFVSPFCPEGFLPSWKTMKCSHCVAGTYYNTSSFDCIACPPGTYQDEVAQTTCKSCPPGTTSEGLTSRLNDCI
ncbi:Sushi, von Willebrand factor type A, EGF and pentraxin domain-containing protein 1 [Holothuria leucospilota]|uniref:Sushi, von Willebrand factor type A, EGF and pentraxin domain-containing protein 1 n=1 Tax=Holothuria leucospilota TaxID=206669 RepID=A0A9Q1BJH5_HOLLE|nr:Sushi, von Willebrand factor type A, EGF and pentraxin domain-containing protein 1 [Holothuria leucospilota]